MYAEYYFIQPPNERLNEIPIKGKATIIEFSSKTPPFFKKSFY